MFRLDNGGFDWCNRCGRGDFCCCDEGRVWPAADGNYYGHLCRECLFLIERPDEWERRRLELVSAHGE